jgi:hypothetical protein
MTKEKELLLANAGLRQLVRSLRYEQGMGVSTHFSLLQGFKTTRDKVDEFWEQWNNETEEMIAQAQSNIQSY